MFPFWESIVAPVIRATGAKRFVEIGALRGENTQQIIDRLSEWVGFTPLQNVTGEPAISLPLGYDTIVGDGGHPLSGGQRQLIALARAVVGEPPLVVLDEPNSNLDGPGEEALVNCVNALKRKGSTVILVSHRPQLVRNLDKLLLIKDGELVAFGESEDVWKELGRPVVIKRGAIPAEPGAAAMIEAASHAG